MMSASSRSRLVVAVILAALLGTVGACSAIAGPSTVCGPKTFPFRDGCMTAAGQAFTTCIDGRGQNLSVEEKAKIEVAVDTVVRGGGSTVVDLSRKVVETEFEDVAKQVVANCLELSKGAATPEELQGIDDMLNDLQGALESMAAGTIRLDPDHGAYEQPIAVIGTGWPANTDLELSFQQDTVDVTTDRNGDFTVTITLDPKFKGPRSVRIRAQPSDPSMVVSDRATYQVDN